MHMDLEVKAPIIIGSIPLRSTFSDLGKEGVEDIEDQETGNPIFEAYPDLREDNGIQNPQTNIILQL